MARRIDRCHPNLVCTLKVSFLTQKKFKQIKYNLMTENKLNSVDRVFLVPKAFNIWEMMRWPYLHQ